MPERKRFRIVISQISTIQFIGKFRKNPFAVSVGTAEIHQYKFYKIPAQDVVVKILPQCLFDLMNPVFAGNAKGKHCFLFHSNLFFNIAVSYYYQM
jgi:hypothetical protein